ncbi:MAG TPA: hypothetical protein VFC63_01575 [Blastocatellia bacterium]|nr:hypothetical protein [Blastocatellia bacterium]
MLDIFSLAVVTIRAVALFVLAFALSGIPDLIMFIRSFSNPATQIDSTAVVVLIGSAMYILISVLFLIFAPKLARLITSGLENTAVQIDRNSYLWLQSIAFSTLGAYFLIIALPTLLKMIIINAFFIPHSVTESSPFTGSYSGVPVGSIVEESARVVLGLVLLLGPRGIASAIGSNWGKIETDDDQETS